MKSYRKSLKEHLEKFNPHTAIGDDLDNIAYYCGIERVDDWYPETDASLRIRILDEIKRTFKK